MAPSHSATLLRLNNSEYTWVTGIGNLNTSHDISINKGPLNCGIHINTKQNGMDKQSIF